MNLIVTCWTFAEFASHRFKEINPATQAPDEIINTDSIISYKVYENDIDFMFIAETEDYIVISFAGTKDIREKNGIKAWIRNINIYPLQDGMIAEGVYNSWEYFKDPIKEYFQNNIYKLNQKLIYVTGHSAGGGIGRLCSRYLAKKLKISHGCITIGAPAQGTSEYVDEYENELYPYITFSIRIVNGYEITESVPPASCGFRHISPLLRLKQPFYHRFFFRITDHFYSKTTKALIKYFKKQGDRNAVRQLKFVLKRTIN